MDAFTAYINLNIDVFFHVETSTDYKIVGKVCFLRKTIYQLKQSAYQQSKNLNKRIVWADLKILTLYYLAFAKNQDTSKVVIVIVYINSFLSFEPDIIEIKLFKFFFSDQYKMKDLNSCDQFTTVKLKQNLE